MRFHPLIDDARVFFALLGVVDVCIGTWAFEGRQPASLVPYLAIAGRVLRSVSGGRGTEGVGRHSYALVAWLYDVVALMLYAHRRARGS